MPVLRCWDSCVRCCVCCMCCWCCVRCVMMPGRLLLLLVGLLLLLRRLRLLLRRCCRCLCDRFVGCCCVRCEVASAVAPFEFAADAAAGAVMPRALHVLLLLRVLRQGASGVCWCWCVLGVLRLLLGMAMWCSACRSVASRKCGRM